MPCLYIESNFFLLITLLSNFQFIEPHIFYDKYIYNAIFKKRRISELDGVHYGGILK